MLTGTMFFSNRTSDVWFYIKNDLYLCRKFRIMIKFVVMIISGLIVLGLYNMGRKARRMERLEEKILVEKHG